MNAKLNYGDRVKLRQLPDQVDSEKNKFPETHKLISQAVGKVFTVRGSNEHGMAELWMNEFGGDSESPCDDSVWIERGYLEKM